MDHNFHVLGRVVLDFFDFDLSLFVGLHNGLHQGSCGGSKGNLRNDQRLFVRAGDAGTHPNAAAPLPVVVLARIGNAAGGKVGTEVKVLALQNGNGRVDQLQKVVRQHLGAQSHGNAFHALGQQQRKLQRQVNGFLGTAVVGGLPLGNLGVEGHFQRKFAQAGFDVTRGGCVVPGQNIPPVSLGFDHQVFLAQLHQGVSNGGIAVGVVLHGVPNHVGHFVEPTVFQFPQRMEQPALHGFETVFQRGNCAFQDDVGGVVQEIILVHGAYPRRGVFERNQFRSLHFQLRTFLLVGRFGR